MRRLGLRLLRLLWINALWFYENTTTTTIIYLTSFWFIQNRWIGVALADIITGRAHRTFSWKWTYKFVMNTVIPSTGILLKCSITNIYWVVNIAKTMKKGILIPEAMKKRQGITGTAKTFKVYTLTISCRKVWKMPNITHFGKMLRSPSKVLTFSILFNSFSNFVYMREISGTN